jgi:Ca2+-binding RTX toxin-like protein
MAQYIGDNTSNFFDGSDEDDFMAGHGHNDFLHGNDGADFIVGGDGNDYLYGGAGDDVLLGGNDNDFLYGGADADVLSGGDGLDFVHYDIDPSDGVGVNVNLTSGEGSGGDAEGDELFSIENVTGTNYDDVLVGSNVANVINAYGGQDYIHGLGGDDTIEAGGGDDQVSGGAGADTLEGGGGIDWISYYTSASGVYVNLTTNQAQGGEATSDIISGFENLVGSDFGDTLIGSNVANVIRGYAGNDYIWAGAGADTLYGDAGVDTANYSTSATGVVVDLASTLGALGDATGDILIGIENLQGSNWVDTLVGNALRNVFHGGSGMDTLNGRDGNDELHGGNAADTITGGAGDDALYGDTGADTITGGAGDDDLYGDTGADTMIGGLGNDDFFVDNVGDVVTELAGQGSDTIYAQVSYTIAANVATLQLAGSSAINATGRDGQADTLVGNSGANVINGKSGGDSIAGGDGIDTLTGGDGTDIFRFSSAPGAANKDTITDFSAPNDVIYLENGVFAALAATGPLAADLFKNLTFGAQDADDRILYNDNTGVISYDADGVGGAAAAQFAVLTGSPTITAADFRVI